MIPGLSLIGAGTDSCIVDTRNFAVSGSRTIEMKDSCLVKGFYILASNNFDYGYGIYSMGQSGLITLNKFSHANSGIYLYYSNIEIYNNYFTNVRRGISIVNSNSKVRKNDIFTLTETGGSGIYHNCIYNNYTPIN